MKSIESLLAIASSPLCTSDPSLSAELFERGGRISSELASLLRRRNGFYAFESALHVLPAQECPGEIGLDRWNRWSTWRSAYLDMAEEGVFFAEDVFGNQFLATPDGVYQFDSETAEMILLGQHLEDWARAILEDSDFLTGFPLAHEWQMKHGPIPQGSRLVPRIPFVAGGEFSVTNLAAIDSIEGLRFRGSIATQIRDLPDGAEIKLEIE